jgi:prolipoprotein diacylglyceryltransferase
MTGIVSRATRSDDRVGDTPPVGQPTPCRGYTSATVPIAVIAFDFDPLVRLSSDLTVRWQTLALAVVALVCLAGAGVLARRRGLRADDLLYVVIGAAPGAVIAGRIGYAVMVPEAFSAGPLSLLDPAVGGLELATAVAGGIGSAAIVAALLGSQVGRWAHIASIPLLAAISAGKLTMVLGGSGQGLPFDGDWATAYVGAGPWVAAAPAVPSHPSQIYEAVGTALVALVILAASSLGVFRSVDGSRLLAAVAGWGVARAVVSVTWRDPVVVGGLPAGGLIALIISVASLIGILAVGMWWPRRQQARAAAAEPRWPEAEVRPPF